MCQVRDRSSGVWGGVTVQSYLSIDKTTNPRVTIDRNNVILQNYKVDIGFSEYDSDKLVVL